ncbi:hypothetical protein E2C01_065125 [Portunus trituberculatus]|uniref:Uncharacterized protein n=1 Tax=Portunus trituberculatus TaxID=210409 RepID=A0A5B7HQW3_PORTR|nr:hypothetical protein [Portunus trituberculatus]
MTGLEPWAPFSTEGPQHISLLNVMNSNAYRKYFLSWCGKERLSSSLRALSMQGNSAIRNAAFRFNQQL